MDDYRQLAGNLNASEWAKKYYGLKRNYDSMSRICKEKCARNEQLEGEMTNLVDRNDKYESLLMEKNEATKRNKQLLSDNGSLQTALADFEKRLNLNQQALIESKDALKRKTRVHLELEATIQTLSRSLSDTKMEHKVNDKKMNDHEATIRRIEGKLNDLELDRKTLKRTISGLKAENATLSTTVIQRENEMLSVDTKYKSLGQKHSEQLAEHKRLEAEQERLKKEHESMATQCASQSMDIEILQNRLGHYERNEETQTRSNAEDKVESLRAMLSDLESQNKHCQLTIDELTAVQKQHHGLTAKYAELKRTHDGLEEKVVDLEAKYNNLHSLYQSKTEQSAAVSARLEEAEGENANLRRNLNERDVELEALQKQHHGLTDSYSDLQHQYSQYLHAQNHRAKSKTDELSERQALLKNDAQRLLLENEEWMSKYNALKQSFDALNDDFIHCKNHKLQLEGLLTETKQFEQKQREQMERDHERKIVELQREHRALEQKLKDIKNENVVLKNKPTLSISEYTMLCSKEEEFESVIKKMFISEQSCEPSFKCTICCDLFVDPITCQPCGHSYCSRCIKKRKSVCKECKIKVKYFSNEILENLTNSFKMRFKTYLPALQQMAKRKTNVLGVSAP